MPPSKYYRTRPTHFSEYQKRWVNANPERKAHYNAKARELHRKNREAAIAMYGGKCACCGESTYEFLAIDHVNGGGTRERKKHFPNSQSFYRWLKDNYDPTTYRLLCHNCNSAYGYYGYCPHAKS